MAARRYRFRRVRPHPFRRVALTLVAIALIGGVAWAVGFLRFVDQLPRAAPATAATAEAAVVLTGGSRRLEAGFALLAAENAPILFVSGVDERVDADELKALIAATTPHLSAETIACCLILGYGATDTIGNARETGLWMRNGDRRSIILVTSNYHMPRARLEFEHAMPGVAIHEHAVVPADVRLDAWWRYPGTLALLAGEWTKYLFAMVRIVATGWISALRPGAELSS